PPFAAPPGPRYARPAARPLARAPRLGLPRRHAEPEPLRQGPSPEPPAPLGQLPVPRVGGRQLADPDGAGRAADADLDGRLARPAVGRPGPHLPGPPRDLERQLRLPSVGSPVFYDRRPEQEQFPVRHPGPRRGLA